MKLSTVGVVGAMLSTASFSYAQPAPAFTPVPFEVTKLRTIMPREAGGEWRIAWEVSRGFNGVVDSAECRYSWTETAPMQYEPCNDPQFRARFPVGHINVPSKDGFAIWMSQKIKNP